MTELNSLQKLAVSELDRLVGKLTVINNDMNAPRPPMKEDVRIEQNIYLASLPSEQTKLIRRIRKWSQALCGNTTTSAISVNYND